MTRNLSTCSACRQPFTEHGWIDRHSVTDTDADQHHLDTGDYHERCCPLCNPPDEATR